MLLMLLILKYVQNMEQPPRWCYLFILYRDSAVQKKLSYRICAPGNNFFMSRSYLWAGNAKLDI